MPQPLDSPTITLSELALALDCIQGSSVNGERLGLYGGKRPFTACSRCVEDNPNDYCHCDDEENRTEASSQADRDASTVYLLSSLIMRILTLQQREVRVSETACHDDEGYSSGLTTRELVNAVRTSLGLLVDDTVQLSEAISSAASKKRTPVITITRPPSGNAIPSVRTDMAVHHATSSFGSSKMSDRMSDVFSEGTDDESTFEFEMLTGVPVFPARVDKGKYVATATPPATPAVMQTVLPPATQTVYPSVAQTVRPPVVQAMPPVTQYVPLPAAQTIPPVAQTIPPVAQTVQPQPPTPTHTVPVVPQVTEESDKYYVVFSGTQLGVFDDWSLARPHVDKVSGGYGKSYRTRAAAERAYARAQERGGLKLLPK